MDLKMGYVLKGASFQLDYEKTHYQKADLAITGQGMGSGYRVGYAWGQLFGDGFWVGFGTGKGYGEGRLGPSRETVWRGV